MVLVTTCMAALGAWSMRQVSAATSEVSKDDLPEIVPATAFEREILNARINFIYHVTIQKPGALETGWERFRNVRALMPKLSAHVSASDALRDLRQPTNELAQILIVTRMS